jgi:glutathione S-transferase
MMKLFYSAGSCSMSCHIALEEAGLEYNAVQPNWDKPDELLAEMYRLNPLEVTPVLITDDNKVLTQNIAILEYIDRLKPSAKLLPPQGTWERSEALSWLSFVAADLHKAFSPLFSLQAISSTDTGRSEVRAWATQNLKQYFHYLDNRLAGKDYLMGNQFCAADAYCFVVLKWSQWLQISLEEFSHLKNYLHRIAQRPAVQKVMKMEGLLK